MAQNKNTKKERNKHKIILVVLIATLAVLIVIVSGYIWYDRTEYYPIRKSCAVNSDCVCRSVRGIEDDCGKPGQVWQYIDSQFLLTFK